MVRSLRSLLRLAAGLLWVGIVTGCNMDQTPRRQIDDNAISAAVKAKLAEQRFSNLVDVSVNVTNGVVTLAGQVPNPQVKLEAEAAARSVKGVVRVNNNLQTVLPTSSAAAKSR